MLLFLSIFTSKNLYNNKNDNKKLIRICQILFYKKTVVEAIFYLLYNGIKLLLFFYYPACYFLLLRLNDYCCSFLLSTTNPAKDAKEIPKREAQRPVKL